MTEPPRVLDAAPVTSLDQYVAAGGGRSLEAATAAGPDAVIDVLEASGLRGRGGAGFPTGRKWRTVASYRSPVAPTTVVVNAAEGEPGSFKDRAILRANPYRVLEGALIAARAVGADRVIVAAKASFSREVTALRAAVDELRRSGMSEGTDIEVFGGPDEYLYGEETALLEVLDGRHPFPRIAPPFRHGVDEVGTGAETAADLELASARDKTAAPPTLVDNVETLANIAGVVLNGPEWFRSVGTEQSPGTIVCTVSGRTRRHGVAEVPMGMPLRQVIDEVGRGARKDRRLTAAISGVANALMPESAFDTPLTYEDMEAAGSGLGACGFIVFDDSTDIAALAAGVSRFLAVESCGQCTPCKRDGLELSERVDALRRSEADGAVLAEVAGLAATVADEARCSLAHQHQRVVESALRLFPDELQAHATGAQMAADSVQIAPIVDIVDGVAYLDERQAAKQPDWSFDHPWSGVWPADRIDERQEAARGAPTSAAG